MPTCYLCGSDATTIDHVPPQGFFTTVPENIIELPACEPCNNTASLDEEYMRTTLAALGYATSAAARSVWAGAVARSFQRRPRGLKARLAEALVTVAIRTSGGEPAGYLPGIQVDGKRALRVLRKIAKGLYFSQRSVRLDDAELLLFRDADVKLEFELITRCWPEVDMGEVFRFRSRHSNEGSLIWFEFFRINWWLALTADLARTYPR